ncbi:MAG TPA: hypothetical protein PLU72_17020 [Candidatus Ozemobacteraceae bacterium]|nr:hypothetical protein [Candidatus Ozemobacteraceae bacterium]
MNLIDDPRIGIPLVVAFAVAVVWANRCPTCGGWFTLDAHRQARNKQPGTFGAPRERDYDITGYSCRRCGASGKTTSDFPRRPAAQVELPGHLQGLSWWHPRVQWAIAPWRTVLASLFIVFNIGFVAYDPEVVLYPSHWQTFLEDYAEFLLDPFNQPTVIKTRVKVAGGNWKMTRFYEEAREEVVEGWKALAPPDAVITESATRSWEPALAREGLNYDPNPVWVKYRRLFWDERAQSSLEGTDEHPRVPGTAVPVPAELAAGVCRPGRIDGSFTILFWDLRSGDMYPLTYLNLRRISDRSCTFKPLDESLYRRLRTSSDTWTARITRYPRSSDAHVELWVDNPASFISGN